MPVATHPLRRQFWSLFYVQIRISIGLLIHPYQTLFELVGRGPTRWLVLCPVAYFVVATLLWRVAVRPLVTIFVAANCALMTIKTAILFFAVFWQASLLYLSCKLGLFSKQERHYE